MIVVSTTLLNSPISCLTNANNAQSARKAISVIAAARKDSSDATSVKVRCCEKEKSSATKVTIAAIEKEC